MSYLVVFVALVIAAVVAAKVPQGPSRHHRRAPRDAKPDENEPPPPAAG